jgi:WD40 repeat protein
MKFPIFNGLISALIFSVSSICAATPFTETALIEPPKGFFVVQAQAAPDATFVALNDGGLEFWLFDAHQQTFKPIAKNAIGDWDRRLHHTQWSDGNLVLFRNWEGVIDIVDPEDLNAKTSFKADLKSAPLRMSQWINKYSMVVDETDFYRIKEGTLSKAVKPNPFAHTVQTGLIIQGDKVITSGLHDQTIKVWSLPDGNLLHDWKVGSWLSKRNITAIALVNGRLLLASQSGHMEERSLTSGEKLWSARPCRGHTNFHYNSQFPQSLSVNVKGGVFFSCGSRVGYIELQSNSWAVASLDVVLNTKNAANELIAAETIPDTNLAVLIFADGKTLVLDKKQGQVVQRLKDVSPGTAGVTYISTSHQLFLAGERSIYLYQLDQI